MVAGPVLLHDRQGRAADSLEAQMPASLAFTAMTNEEILLQTGLPSDLHTCTTAHRHTHTDVRGEQKCNET